MAAQPGRIPMNAKRGRKTMFAGLLFAALAACPSAFAADQGEAQESPIVGTLRFETGMRAAQAGDLFTAARIFNALLQQQPHLASAYIGLAEVQARAGRLDEADTWLARGMAADPASSAVI